MEDESRETFQNSTTLSSGSTKTTNDKIIQPDIIRNGRHVGFGE